MCFGTSGVCCNTPNGQQTDTVQYTVHSPSRCLSKWIQHKWNDCMDYIYWYVVLIRPLHLASTMTKLPGTASLPSFYSLWAPGRIWSTSTGTWKWLLFLSSHTAPPPILILRSFTRWRQPFSPHHTSPQAIQAYFLLLKNDPNHQKCKHAKRPAPNNRSNDVQESWWQYLFCFITFRVLSEYSERTMEGHNTIQWVQPISLFVKRNLTKMKWTCGLS